jgi:peptidoglycan/LPS O-acetylase OafA/YrhL
MEICRGSASDSTLHVMQVVMALAVLTSHWGYPYNLQYVAQVKLPVDYFFFIEGFLARQWLSRAATAVPPLQTILQRVCRIYPLHIIGLCAGAAAVVSAARAHESGWTFDGGAAALSFGLLLQPTFSTGAEGAVFPLNPPSWAIIVEIWAFAGLVLFRRQLGFRVLAIIFLSAAVVLLGWIIIVHDNNMGWRTLNYWGGYPRVIFGFFGGAFLCELNHARVFRLPRLHPLLIWSVVVASLVIPIQQALFQLALLFVIPLIVLIGAASLEPRWISSWGAVAKRHAYGIYLLSYPSLLGFRQLGNILGVSEQTMGSFAGYLVVTGLIVLLVHVFVRVIDEPIRRSLDEKFFETSGAASSDAQIS